MGYCINISELFFTIKQKNFATALAALKKQSGRITSWVNQTKLQNATSLDMALDACRWHAEHTADVPTEDISHLYFQGEKLGDESALFDILAPFVEAGSYIRAHGEDDSAWEWRFDGKEMEEVSAYLDFDGNHEIVEALLKHKKILPTLLGIDKRLDKRISETLK